VYVVHNLQILGEAAYKLPLEYKEANPDIPWHSLVGMRHILVHDYFHVDLDIVWAVVTNELPSLKAQVQRLLNHLKSRLVDVSQ